MITADLNGIYRQWNVKKKIKKKKAPGQTHGSSALAAEAGDGIFNLARFNYRLGRLVTQEMQLLPRQNKQPYQPISSQKDGGNDSERDFLP